VAAASSNRNIRSGVNIFGVDGAATIQDISAANATSSQVLASNTFFSATGGIKTGTMTNVGVQTITPTTSNTVITAGYHNGSGYCAGDANLAATNIKSGVSIFGTAGSFKSVLPDTGQAVVYATNDDGTYTASNSAVCNRAASGSDETAFHDNGDGTIIDYCTNLTWQKCSDGLSGTNCGTGTAVFPTWSAAISYCNGLSLGGAGTWRLPNINELLSIVNYSTYSPIINVTYFPATVSNFYWSSSTSAYSTGNAWGVYFDYGNTYGNGKGNGYYVRCVRGQ
jgi:Protein of unknown function (DUF1566)